MIVDLSQYPLPDEAVLREVPSQVLPDPASIVSTVTFDVESTGLWVDEGDTVAAVGVAYRLDDQQIWYHGFPFDQGRAADKGFEVVPLKDTPINRRANAVGLPAGDPFGHWDWDTDYNLPRSEWEFLCDWLHRCGEVRGLSNQNIKFDIHMMRRGTRHWRGIELERYARWDPMLANPWVWPKAGTNALKPVAAIHWGDEAVAEAEVVKVALLEVRKRYGLIPKQHGPRYDLLPWQVNGPYVASDGVLAKRLEELQQLRVEEGWALGYKLDQQVRLLRVLTRMERRGFGPYDVDRSRQIADRIDEKIEKLAANLPFEPVTSARAAEYFYDQLGMAPWRSELGEKPRKVEIQPDTRKHAREGATRRVVVDQGDCSSSVARRMAKAGVPFAAEWAQILELTIANKMFYRNYADLAGPDLRLRTSFKQAYVRSGRMSVERWQAQAMPKKLGLELDGERLVEPRALFLIPPGKRRMNLDLGQAELRIASSLAGCKVMLDAVSAGADFHGQTTTRIFGMHEDHPEWKLYRDIGKRCTFSSIFQVGPQTFRETLWDEAGIDWSLAECRRTIYAWRDTYPEFTKMYYYWAEFAERNLYVPLVDGTPSFLATARDYPHTAWSRRVQASLASFVTDWLVMVEKHTARLGALLLTVHDSVILDLPEDRADEICEELRQMTEELWERWFGIPGKVDVSEWDYAA